MLAGKDYLASGHLSVMIVRFDPVFVCRFKRNLRKIRSGCPAIDL